MRERQTAASPSKTFQPGARAQSAIVPIIHENFRVTKLKRKVGSVKVRLKPHIRTETVEVPIVQEAIDIERVPLNRIVDKPFPIRQEGDTTIVPVFQEVVVVEKRLVLKEEIRVTRRRISRKQVKRVKLRSEEAEITRDAGSKPT